MSIVKSFSVEEGDTYYIRHDSDNFSIIDCNLTDYRKDEIIDELNTQSSDKGIIRFISTHPDEDHIHGIESLDASKSIVNFYCVQNKVSKQDETISFKKYCKLRDSDKAYYIYKGCSRRWLNLDNEERKSSGIKVHWPDVNNPYFKEELKLAEESGDPNNISPIISYSMRNIIFVWMGDLKTEYMEIYIRIFLLRISLSFLHHIMEGKVGNTGRFPEDIKSQISNNW